MIIAIYGQPCAGKTTIARALHNIFLLKNMVMRIDGDDLRNIFQNNKYDKEGRMENLRRASDIAAYLHSKDMVVILSVMYPYEESRQYLNSLCPNTKWVYVYYDSKEKERGRESYHMKDFESPSMREINKGNTISVDTTDASVESVVEIIKKAYL